MNENILVELLIQAVVLILKTSAPMLLVSLVVGFVISILQTVTSIQEQTLTFVPKLVAIFVTLVLTGNWVFKSVAEFLQELCLNFSYYIHG